LTDIYKKTGLLSVVSNHRLEHNHEMNCSEATILDIEPSFTKKNGFGDGTYKKTKECFK